MEDQFGLWSYDWLTKSEDSKAGDQFVSHEYDYNMKSCYQLVITITFLEKKYI